MPHISFLLGLVTLNGILPEVTTRMTPSPFSFSSYLPSIRQDFSTAPHKEESKICQPIHTTARQVRYSDVLSFSFFGRMGTVTNMLALIGTVRTGKPLSLS